MTHEGNTQVKETKALTLTQKYEAFKMEDDDSVEMMFSRFQTLVEGLKVMNKGYSTTDLVKKIIKSLPKRWRPMVTVLKLSSTKYNGGTNLLKELKHSNNLFEKFRSR